VSNPKTLAFYLPQYHAIPENDEWWGKGFTEWTNLKRAVPLFDGHDQPRIPLSNNYYDLTDDAVKEWQVRIAKSHGVDGFCFYHYWFGGKLMLERPLDQFLENKDLDIEFCFCWANPPWTKIWAGKGSQVLIGQDYGDEEQWEAHFQYLLPFFKDDRYIKEDGAPLFVIYTPIEIPCIKEMLEFFKRRAVEEGFTGLKTAYQYYVSEAEDAKLRPLFDYCITFQPTYATAAESGNSAVKSGLMSALKKVDAFSQKVFHFSPSDHLLKLRRYDYDKVWEDVLNRPIKAKDLPCAFVDFDNTPRRGKSGKMMMGASPEKFKRYFRRLLKRAKDEYHAKYLFITAWNEWTEGAYLEPDETHGFGYLDAIAEVMAED